MLDQYGLAALHLQRIRMQKGAEWGENDALWFDPERGVIAGLGRALRWLRGAVRPRLEPECEPRDVCTAR